MLSKSCLNPKCKGDPMNFVGNVNDRNVYKCSLCGQITVEPLTEEASFLQYEDIACPVCGKKKIRKIYKTDHIESPDGLKFYKFTKICHYCSSIFT